MATRLLRHVRSNVIGYAAVFIALGGVAYASIPSASGVFTGCHATTSASTLEVPYSKGDLRLVKADESCRSYEKKVTWNQAGPPGIDGQDGQDGVSGYEVVVGDVATLDTFENRSIVFGATCPEGKKALGGGWRSAGGTSPAPTFEVQNNTINPSSDRTWNVGISEAPDNSKLGGTRSFRAFVTCAIVN